MTHTLPPSQLICPGISFFICSQMITKPIQASSQDPLAQNRHSYFLGKHKAYLILLIGEAHRLKPFLVQLCKSLRACLTPPEAEACSLNIHLGCVFSEALTNTEQSKIYLSRAHCILENAPEVSSDRNGGFGGYGISELGIQRERGRGTSKFCKLNVFPDQVTLLLDFTFQANTAGPWGSRFCSFSVQNVSLLAAHVPRMEAAISFPHYNGQQYHLTFPNKGPHPGQCLVSEPL